MNTPILETERLILRPITLADAEEIFRNWTSDPDVARYMAYSTHENVGVTQEWLRMVEANRGLPTNFDWGFARKSDGRLIGSGGIYYKEDSGMFELGYNIMKECWHQGYTTEALRRLLAFAFEEGGVYRVSTGCLTENRGSERVMQKCGLIKEAEKPDWTWHGGKLKTRVEYRLLRQEWTKS